MFGLSQEQLRFLAQANAGNAGALGNPQIGQNPFAGYGGGGPGPSGAFGGTQGLFSADTERAPPFTSNRGGLYTNRTASTPGGAVRNGVNYFGPVDYAPPIQAAPVPGGGGPGALGKYSLQGMLLGGAASQQQGQTVTDQTPGQLAPVPEQQPPTFTPPPQTPPPQMPPGGGVVPPFNPGVGNENGQGGYPQPGVGP